MNTEKVYRYWPEDYQKLVAAGHISADRHDVKYVRPTIDDDHWGYFEVRRASRPAESEAYARMRDEMLYGSLPDWFNKLFMKLI